MNVSPFAFDPAAIVFDFGGTLATDARRDVDDAAMDVLRIVYEAGYKIVLLSNTRPGASRQPGLARAGVIDWFTAILESDVTGEPKPSPGAYESAIAAAGCEPGEVIHVYVD